ncbi:G-protein coupled receptor dmsr-1 isoform X1 [Drosophila mojavensis]|uniref:Probable G-protein coupled receptor 139 isoform X1 n=1 Tax=Drosophila arizonae TaxID=7263 RepID=A0ABM1PF34_DROAR|nr:PREDICTED: probable G-protein coupled receptor 139 isoform X1 [Drosophila arizonae]XP_017865820.1 PREDICTED: probable G-protein coupled receptor 139 isoform X1 [Drosophila arizonae]XP_032585854.1 G-protein coupled receptor dmsr-1 isoform X1 [Drosophila mojavensis]XP_032585855.1 G-protein coupled receptor dmsr-1 isoform X1 [Drosophila mojavensis]XP_043866864.1 G-protein coupled receptor dmsr-1 isoform X1 [Drosophila mojavensis]
MQETNMAQRQLDESVSLNETLLKDLEITRGDIQDFVKLLFDFQKKNQTQQDECQGYCQGEIYTWLRAYNGIHGYVSLLICIFGTIANILNIMVLTRKEMAKAPINNILKWLAVADMFVMLEYIPYTTYQYIYMKPGEKDLSYAWAVYLLVHMHFTQILHTISIGLTVTLAVWRYVAISKLFPSLIHRHPNGSCANFLLAHSREAILFPFIVSPILCLPTYFVFKVRETHEMDTKEHEAMYHVYFDTDSMLFRFNFWIHSVIIKLLPCFILTVISLVLMHVLCEASRRRLKLKDYDNPTKYAIQLNLNESKSRRPPRCDRRNDRTTLLLVAVLILFLVTEFPQGLLGLLSGVLEKCFFAHCYPPFGELMDLLALINAAVGFVLYGLMSKQFRTTFRSLFFKRHFGSSEMTRLTRVTTTCV